MTAPDVRREDLVSRASAAQHLGIHGNTFDRWAKRVGLVRYRVIGDNRIFYHRGEIDSKYTEIEVVEAAS